jgi:hypothetical protein
VQSGNRLSFYFLNYRYNISESLGEKGNFKVTALKGKRGKGRD